MLDEFTSAKIMQLLEDIIDILEEIKELIKNQAVEK